MTKGVHLEFHCREWQWKKYSKILQFKNMKTCPINSLAKYDVGKVDDPELCEHLKFNIFESIGDGREFVYKFHRTIFMQFMLVKILLEEV